MRDNIDSAALARYFAEECTEREEVAIMRWIDAEPSRRHLIDRLREVWKISGTVHLEVDVEAALRKVKSHPGAGGRTPVAPVRSVHATASHNAPFARRLQSPWHSGTSRARLAAAAAVLLSIAAAMVWQSTIHSTTAPLASADFREIVTRKGQRASILLADSSRVLMGPESRLRFASSEPTHSRDVYLDGAGYFTVVHDPKRPFLVHAGNAVTEDLGTEFGIDAYGDGNAVQVVVATGQVRLRADSAADEAGAILTAHMRGTLSQNGSVLVERDVDMGRAIAWTDGRLIFDDAPLPEVLQQLNRWYDVEFVIGDSALARNRLTASFRDKSSTEVLNLLSLALGARYERSGRTVRLYVRREGSRSPVRSPVRSLVP